MNEKNVQLILINPFLERYANNTNKSMMFSSPPLGLGYIASYLETKNYKIEIIDQGVENCTIEEICNRIQKNYCKCIGISLYISNYKHAMTLAKLIKDKIDNVTIVFGGPLASFIDKEIINFDYVDIVSRFEGEYVMEEILEYIYFNKPLDTIRGITFIQDGMLHQAERRELEKNIDKFPLPAWHLLDIHKYYQPGIIISGRGCPYECIFCSAKSLSGGSYRRRSVENIMSEILLLYHKYKIREFIFADDSFTANRKHCIEICNEIIRNNLKITWTAELRADSFDDELAQIMFDAGCRFIQIGAESGDDNILREVKKNISLKDIENSVRIAVGKGIKVICSFIIGHGNDTEQTINKTVNFAIKLKKINPELSKSKFAILTPIPGTCLFDDCEKNNIELITKDFTKYNFVKAVHNTKYLSHLEIDFLYQQAILRYAKA
jgi:radical SAM superfamily enzyme YgiQ (UPF0313 family)